VWVWTVNDLAIAKRVYDWGAERIFTDKPFLFA
jgi:glycerophosphoryl diester phosphodiesterase